MPKVSKAAASSHLQIPGVYESFRSEIEGWTVSLESYSIDMDGAILFKGAPDDQCQASHMDYVVKGKIAIRTADGAEEVFEAGDACFIGPGHIPIFFAGSEVVEFTRTEEANAELAVVMPNLKKYMEEHGMEQPNI